MPYTSQGWMSHGDITETLKDMDMGSTTITMDDPPEWFDVSKPETCPVCGEALNLWEHDQVVVQDASGEVFACLRHDGVWRHEQRNDVSGSVW